MADGTLFTRDFLERGICETREWKELDDKVVADFKATVGEIFRLFPHDKKPNETQTEDDLIWKVLVALGWNHSLRQQNLSSKGRENVPDGLLFADEEAKARANAREQDYQRYADGLAIVESKRWARLLDREDARKGDDLTVPSTQMLRYLRRVDDRTDGKVRWGILTNGREWRLYWQGAKSVSEDFLEMELPGLAGIDGFLPSLFDGDPNHFFKVFVLMFRRAAFVPSDAIDGRTFHQLALDEGRYWESRVAEDLSDLVFRHVFPALVRSVVANDPLKPKPLTEAYLAEAKDAALILLYRLLFILFAEDRNLLPAKEVRYDDYGMRKKVRDDIASRTDGSDTFAASIGQYYLHMRQLFRAIAKGEPSLGLPPYNGGLFDENRTPILRRTELPDADFAPVIDALSRHDEKGRKRRINYRDLSVQQIGSIYERLLEFEVRAAEDGVSIEDDSSARKGSGSYYTPEEPVQLIIGKTVGPLLDDRQLEFMEKAEILAHDKRAKVDRIAELEKLDPASRFLEIKVCDPAMGSGHFLVSLVDYMADRVLEAMAEATETVDWADPEQPYVSPLARNIKNIRSHILDHAEKGKWVLDESQLDDRQVVRRMILKRVVYGVDKNPMAVELAKVSLWLHTFTVGAPLSFLEHHLRCGDSIAGEWVRPVEDELAARGAMFLNKSVAQAKQAAKGMAKVERLTDTDIAEVRTSSETFRDVEETTAPLAGFLDIIQARRWHIKKDKSEEAAFQALLDGKFGNPVRIAAGLDSIVAPDGADEPSFLPDEKPEQDSLLPEVSRDHSLFRTFAVFLKEARALADRENFMHWQVAFPGVWGDWESTEPTGGFDAVIGNPPYVRQELLGPMKPYLKEAYDSFHGMADLYIYFYELGLKILKPGGRLSYIVTNKWMKAGYGEPLRRMFADRAWMETVVDFGHAKQIFKDADVFPSVIVARRPDKTDKPKKVNVCIIPREILRMDDLSRQVRESSFGIERRALGNAAWQLEPPEVSELLAKIASNGRPLADLTGDRPCRGILTGLNEAFVIDASTRDQLVSVDSKLNEIIRPFLRGQDMARWHTSPTDYWMIVLKSSENHKWPWSDADNPEDVLSQTFPSLYKHVKKFEDKLRRRQDKGRHWWELRSCTYYEKFDKPKIIYQEITWRPQFCLDNGGSLLVNTAYFLPTDDRWIVAVMNSPLGWWFAWRMAQHGKDEALRYIASFVEGFPIAEPNNELSRRSTKLVDSLGAIHSERASVMSELFDWLYVEYDVQNRGRRLQAVFDLDSDEFVLEIRKTRGTKKSLSAAALKSLRDEYANSIEPIRRKLSEAGAMERELSDLVNQAYGLTAKDIALMWRTAPPRMPLAGYYVPAATEEPNQ